MYIAIILVLKERMAMLGAQGLGELQLTECQEKKLKQNLTTIAAYNGLVPKGILNDSALTPSKLKYTIRFNKQILSDMDEEMSICRKLR